LRQSIAALLEDEIGKPHINEVGRWKVSKVV
jgi:hypothetical protein